MTSWSKVLNAGLQFAIEYFILWHCCFYLLPLHTGTITALCKLRLLLGNANYRQCVTGYIISSGSHRLEMSFFSTCCSVMLWYTTSQKVPHNSRLKRQHGQSQVRCKWGYYSVDCNPVPVSFIVPVHFFRLLQAALHAEMENFKSRIMFILVSTVMTWAMTKPQNPVSL